MDTLKAIFVVSPLGAVAQRLSYTPNAIADARQASKEGDLALVGPGRYDPFAQHHARWSRRAMISDRRQAILDARQGRTSYNNPAFDDYARQQQTGYEGSNGTTAVSHYYQQETTRQQQDSTAPPMYHERDPGQNAQEYQHESWCNGSCNKQCANSRKI